MKHTEDKWKVSDKYGDNCVIVTDKTEIAVCSPQDVDGQYIESGEITQANARRIVQCVNSHDELVKAAQTTINRLKGTVARAAFEAIGQLGALNMLFDELEQALANATESS